MTIDLAEQEIRDLRVKIERLLGQRDWMDRNSVLRNPAQATIADYLAVRCSGDWETPCPRSGDKRHCVHWYDGEKCCTCGDRAAISAP